MSFVFLFCTERSGSNLITSLMNGHSKISGPPPSHMFRLFGLNCQNYFPTSHEENWNHFVADFVDATRCMIGDWDNEIDAISLNAASPNRSIAEAFDFLYSAERRSGEYISFVKENHAYLITPFILSNWPNAKFVYQVRDPRDVAASWVRAVNTKGGVRHAVEIWLRDQAETLNVFRQLQSAGRILRVRYEDLISDPAGTAQILCDHIGVDFESSMLEFHRDERTQRNAQRVAAWNNLASPILKDNSGKHRATLTDDDIRFVELSCWRLMQIFGYELETNADTVAEDEARAEMERLGDLVSPGLESEQTIDKEAAFRSRRLALIERVKLRGAAR